MNKTIKISVLSVTISFIFIILLSIPVANNIVPNAFAAPAPEPGSLSILSLTGLYFVFKALKRKKT